MIDFHIDEEVLYLRVGGRLEKDDYDRFAPFFDQLAKRRAEKIPVLIELSPDFAGWDLGGLWSEFNFDRTYWSLFDRTAIVGDNKWEEWGSRLTAPFFRSAEIRFFHLEQRSEAEAWVRAGNGEELEARDRQHSGEHSHAHLHAGHTHAPASFGKAFAIGIGLNVAFVIIEASYGILGNSLALLADAGHNLSDVFGLVIAWVAVLIGRKAPTRRYTYGLQGSSILAALFNGVFLMLAAGAIAWQAILRFFEPAAVAGNTVVIVAAIGIAINTGTALLFLRGRKGDINIQGAFLHMAADAAVSAGVVIAGFAIRLTGWNWLDPVTSLVIVGVIVWSTWGLLREAFAMSLNAVPSGIDVDAVEKHLVDIDGVAAVHDLHIWAMSTTDTALTAHLVVPDPRDSQEFLHVVAADLKANFGIGHTTLQIEREARVCVLEPDDVV